ncbi:MAG: hypothetical protein QM642_10685 [Edaphocola sp.]
MKYRSLAIHLLSLMLIEGCIKDYVSSTRTLMANQTPYDILIVPYKNGVLDMGNMRTVSAMETIEVYADNVMGKSLDPCWGTLLQPYDSVLVTFQSMPAKTSVHYSWRDTLISSQGKVPFLNERNISDEQHYNKVITKEDKNYLVGYYEYTFTESDYEYAQK